ncbi:helicase HerA domain-containing protein [Deinococcus aestuarii]|uniref:helicase HerA domain-containing protein n=1 Tax=Deinococcus aestuarii TaxID=2774531 RepID=UPI001C0B7D8E|nr:DUF87 domain-containing protein [Deinococcus aestuarii]
MTRGSQILRENHEEAARQEQEARELARRRSAAQLMGALIQPERYVGEVFTVGFSAFTVQVHDHFRREVQGIPQGAFLIATCIDPGCSELDPDGEGTEIVLLRVIEPRTLPREGEREDQRTEAIERAMRDERPWEDQVDKYTRNKLSYSGLTCRVLGTVYLEPDPDHPEQLRKRLGTDIDNFYSGRGMKVYKPSGAALAALVNYSDPDVKSDHPLGGRLVNIAAIRYASTRRSQSSDAVDVTITPADLIGQKTALFGMTRSGKSNTTKVIAQAIYELRRDAVPLNPSDTPEQAERRARSNRIGQLIFDPQGEYANENVQDGGTDNPNALKNIYTHFPNLTRESELATYGLKPHPRDPHRELLKINFYGEPLHAAQLRQLESASQGHGEANLDAATAAFLTNIHTLLLGKQLFDEALAGSDSQYIRNFLAADLSLPDFSTFPDQEAYGQAVRYNRNLLVYRALLHGGGLRAPFAPDITNLFNAQLRETLRTPPAEGTGTRRNARSDRDASLQNEFSTAADLLEQAQVSWDDVITICKALAKLIGRPEFDAFDAAYRRGHNGRSWADATFRNLIGMFAWSNGPKLAARVRENHEAGLTEDYAETIYQDLLNGKMVIIDQSLGGAGPNQVVANKIIEKILQRHVEVFGMGESPHPILVYVEEAHNLLPKRSADGEVNIWARLAKEGAKLNLGLVYATQEVSALQSNILKNTSNWFIAHLNNTEEVREVSKYYDFEDFAESIQRAPNRGFIRMRTRTNVFTIPVQVRKFDLSTSALPASTVPVHGGND